MVIAGLIGDPVGHSLSAVMHNAAFAHLGLDATYELWQTPLADLPGRVATLRGPGILGANVTVPHKQAVMSLIDEISVTARRIGAVNTIIPHAGILRGENTDAWGFARSLDAVAQGAPMHTAVVAGAGGASRAVLISLQEAGCERIVLVNRTHRKALDLAASLATMSERPVEVREWGELSAVVATADLVVNATSIGWHGDELPFDDSVLDHLTGIAIVIDLTYRETALLRLAKYRGLRTLDGLPMLVHQGARAFELWTGEPAPIDVMTEAVLAEQARRTLM
ncbi:MAG TPA: shikimate dehydrogenase [Thermomicrobiales bacterium]|nr:shikimate dehydrogenase [Thermomicrobiales bacterium]